MDYHRDRFHDFSLLIYKNDKLIALLPANKKDTTVYSHQGLTYGDFIYSKHLKTTDYINLFKSVLKFLKAQNINQLIIKEIPNIYLLNSTNNPLQYVMFKTKAKLLKTELHTVLDQTFVKYSNSRKEGVKRAEKHGLHVEETNDLKVFWTTILTPNLKQKHNVNPVHTVEEITFLKSQFNKNIRQFNVYNNTTILAGVTIFETTNVAHCQYISGNENRSKFGSLDLLHHHLITTVFKAKKYFSFGISNVNNGQQINEGLQFWKEGFGARTLPKSVYQIDTKNYELLDNVFI